MALLRHGEGLGLAGRSGRDPLHVPRGSSCRARAGGVRSALLPLRERQDLPARVRRSDEELRRGRSGVPHCGCGGPHGPRDAAHAVRALAGVQHVVLHRVPRAGPDHERRRVRGRDGAVPGGRLDPPLPLQADDHHDGRVRSLLLLGDVGAHVHGRRDGDGAARGHSAGGPRVRAVPPDGHLRRGLSDDGGLPRRGRRAAQQRGRAFHGALRADGEGPGVPRRGVARDDDGDPRGPRRGEAEGPHLPAPGPPAGGPVGGASAGHL